MLEIIMLCKLFCKLIASLVSDQDLLWVACYCSGIIGPIVPV